MATLRDIKTAASSQGIVLSTKQANFLHKHQNITAENFVASYAAWFSEDPDSQTQDQLLAVLASINPTPDLAPEATSVDAPASNESATEDLVEGPEVAAIDQLPVEVPESDPIGSSAENEEQQIPPFDPAEETVLAAVNIEVTPEPAALDVIPNAIPETIPSKPFTPWWTDAQVEATAAAESEVQLRAQPRPNVEAYLDVTRRLEDDRFELIDVSKSDHGVLELSWSPVEGEQTYVLCVDSDHYPFEVTVDNAVSVSGTSAASYLGPDTFFTVFAFTGSGSKGYAWAKGRYIADVEWFNADVVDGKVSLRWSEIPADLDLRVAKSNADQALVDLPTANYWLPVSGKNNSFVDEKVELGKRYEYRAYLEWIGPDRAVHATAGISVAAHVLIDFPRVLSFDATLDQEVSGKVVCHVEGVNVPDYVQVFEIDGLPGNELLAALSDKRQLQVSELNHLKTRAWLGQSLVGARTQTANGVELATLLSNAGKVSKSFVLVLTLGSVAQVSAVASVQRVGEIIQAELIEKFDYQLIRLGQPQGAQSLDIWMVAASVPFDQIAHTPPNRRVLIQEEYLRYGGILFADNVPNKPQIRRLAPSAQTIYIRGASTFEGVTEFGSVVQVNYPGRIKLAYMAEPDPTETEVKPKKTDTAKRSWPWKKPPKELAAPTVEPQEQPADLPAAQSEQARATNKTIDSLGSKLIGNSTHETKASDKSETLLKKFLNALTRKNKSKKALPQPEGPRVLIRVDGTEPTHNLSAISALHFAGDTFPLDEHDCTVPKAPLELTLVQNRGSFRPHQVAEGKDGEPIYLRLDRNLQHRFQIQSEIPGDTLRGVRCFSLDATVEMEIKKRTPAPLGDIELSTVVIGSPGSGKSTYLAALTHYLQEQYELLVKAEITETEESSGALRTTARQLANDGKLPRRGRPVTGSDQTAASILKLESKSAVPVRQFRFVDTSGIDLEAEQSLQHASDELLSADLLVITVDPTLNPTVSSLAGGIVASGEVAREADEPFWLLQRIGRFLSENKAARNPNQRVAICVTKFDALEIASDISGTSLSGTIRNGMALARDPHMLWAGEYLESFGALQDKEIRALLGRVSGYGPFLKLVDDTFQPGEVRYFAVSALGRSNFSDTLGGGGLTSIRVSDPIRWGAREAAKSKVEPASA